MLAHRIAIVAAADEAFAMPLAVTLSSALLRLPEDVVPELHVFDGGMSRDAAGRLARLVPVWHRRAELFLHPTSEGVFAGIDTGVFPPAVLLRLLIPDAVPEHHERVLYLDSDIVVERDLSQLWDLPMEGVPLYAVMDFGVRLYPDNVERMRVANGMQSKLNYFNSGVLLLNPGVWRQEALGARMVDVLRHQRPGSMHYPDQDAMNLVLAGRWRELEPFWNFQALPDPRVENELFGGANRRLLDEPKLIHYTGNKPWSRHSYSNYFRSFVGAYMRSRWDRAPLAAAKAARLWTRRLLAGVSRRRARALDGG